MYLYKFLFNPKRTANFGSGLSLEKDSPVCKPQDAGAQRALLSEKFGPSTFYFALVTNDNKLSLIVRHWKAFGIYMPLILAPRMTVFESVTDDKFWFHVEASYPIVGLIIRYKGWLVPTT